MWVYKSMYFPHAFLSIVVYYGIHWKLNVYHNMLIHVYTCRCNYEGKIFSQITFCLRLTLYYISSTYFVCRYLRMYITYTKMYIKYTRYDMYIVYTCTSYLYRVVNMRPYKWNMNKHFMLLRTMTSEIDCICIKLV